MVAISVGIYKNSDLDYVSVLYARTQKNCTRLQAKSDLRFKKIVKPAKVIYFAIFHIITFFPSIVIFRYIIYKTRNFRKKKTLKILVERCNVFFFIKYKFFLRKYLLSFH